MNFVVTPTKKRDPTSTGLSPRTCRHEKVLEQVMCCSPVLPVVFAGQVFSSPWAVKAFLVSKRLRIARFLSHAADREEWAVKGTSMRSRPRPGCSTTIGC